MFASRLRLSGHACVQAAFPADYLHGLPEAVAALEHAHASLVVPELILSLNPQHWRSSRSAVDGLRGQGRAGMCAAPAIAGWLKLCVDHGMESEQKYGLNEALHTLTTLRELAAESDPVSPPEALERLRRFLDEVFQPYLLTLLTPPVRYWQRGIIGYLRALNGDLEGVAAALQRYAVTLRETTWRSGTNSDWDEYTHSEVLAVIGALGPQLDRLRVERHWREQRPAVLPAPPDIMAPEAEPPDPAEQSIAWARQELVAPSVSRRRAACRAIRQLGAQARPLAPALLAMLAQLDDATPAVVTELRAEGLAALRAIEPPPPAFLPGDDPDAGDDTDEGDDPDAGDDAGGAEDAGPVSTEALDRLLVLAGEDADAGVRTAALHAIASTGTPRERALAVALRAAAAEDPQERAAAARLLAMLARG